MAMSEPRASPSGPTWQARATDSARSIAATARSSSLMVVAPQSPQDVFDPGSSCYRRIDLKGKLRGPFHAQLAANSRLEPHPVLLQRLLGRLGQRGQHHGGAPQVGVDLDGSDGEQVDALVGIGQPLELLGQHLTDHLVDPGRAGIAPVTHSAHTRTHSSTSTSGNDHTNRSTWSSTSDTWPTSAATAAIPNPARCH